MKQKVFTTKDGVDLIFDSESYSYETTDVVAVRKALNEDEANKDVDPQAAAAAHNLLAIMESMDYARNSLHAEA